MKETTPTAPTQKKQIVKKISKDTEAKQPPIKLYICTIFPGMEDDNGKTIISEEMNFIRHKLSKIKDLEPHFIWIKAGMFSHRHLKHVPDPDQIKHRNVYLDKVPNGEWLLVLDSDELLFGALTNIPVILRILNVNPHIDYAMISELLPNGELKLRPRLIRKREGLKYGGPLEKHDYIEHCGCYVMGNFPCEEYGVEHTYYNYIDVKAEKRSWLLDFLGFFHYKNGWAMELYSNDDQIRFEIPSNMVTLERDTGAFHTHNEEGTMIMCQGSETGYCKVSVTTTAHEAFKQYKAKEQEDKYNAYKEIVRD